MEGDFIIISVYGTIRHNIWKTEIKKVFPIFMFFERKVKI